MQLFVSNRKCAAITGMMAAHLRLNYQSEINYELVLLHPTKLYNIDLERASFPLQSISIEAGFVERILCSFYKWHHDQQ